MGLPNCCRGLAYSMACSIAARAMPTANMAVSGRLLSSVFIAMKKPSPSCPMRLATGTLHVFEGERDGVGGALAHLVLVLADGEPFGAALDHEAHQPLVLACEGSLVQNSEYWSAYSPLVIHCFWPLTT